jgi:SagB-type dehydrogenase family enzyme
MPSPATNIPKNLTFPGISFLIISSIILFSYFSGINRSQPENKKTNNQPTSEIELINPIKLPSPATDSRFSLEKALKNRRSRREFIDKPLELKQISQLLWAAQGVTVDWGGRTAPSVKSVYPLTIYLASFNVDSLNHGFYQYWSGELSPIHQLTLVKPGNIRENLTEIINQTSITSASALLIISANFDKMTKAFDDKNNDFNVYLEAGHVGQNIYLQAESLGLGTVSLTSFDKNQLKTFLELPKEETPIYLFPIGLPKE